MVTTVVGVGLSKEDMFNSKYVELHGAPSLDAGTTTVVDTGKLDKPIEVLSLDFDTEENTDSVRIYVYNKDGSITNISYIYRGISGYSSISPYSLYFRNQAKETSLFKLAHYDTSNDDYHFFLKQPIICHGIRIDFVKASGTIVSYTVVYREIG